MLLSMRGMLAGGCILAMGIVASAWLFAAPPTAAEPGIEFAANGKLKRPIGYREWTFVGSSVTPNDLNGGEALFPEFHSVYIDPKSYAEYKKTGKYRDGTIMIKELVSVGGKEASSGKGYFMGDFLSLEVSIKDSKRFKDEPGAWAYFSFSDKPPLKSEASFHATASCNKCHQDDAAEDFVFSQDYPGLRALQADSK